MIEVKNPLIVALDLDDKARALQLAKELGPKVGALKIGPRLNLRYGQSLIQEMAGYAPIFIDNKFLDIPNTMLSSVRAAFEAGASFCTIHAWSGLEALGQISDLEKELNQIRPFQILVVTVLTSFTEELLPPTMVKDPIEVQVRRLAHLAWEAGLTGFVCSPFEVAELKKELKNGFFVTPGVRFGDGQLNDQKRVKSPGEAVQAGASMIVVGRPIVEAKDFHQAVEKFLADLP